MALIGTSAVAVVGESAAANSGPDIVISELMINPRDVFDSRGEWVELTNVGDTTVNLNGWTFTDERRENVVLPALDLSPGEYIVVARTGDPATNGGVDAAWVYGNEIVLYNPSDRLILSDASGAEQDRVDWYPESGLVAPDGQSLARDPRTLSPGAAAAWCASTTIMRRGDLGSPGAPNLCEQSPSRLVITEVLQNPKSTSDQVGEFFEVYNPGSAAVDMAGWTIKDDDNDRFTVDGSVVVAPGGHAVFGITADGNGAVDLDYTYGGAMRLHNDVDELVIADGRGILVDRVAWDDGRTFPDRNGASMSLLDAASDNAVGSNWCMATTPWGYGDFGSPGSATRCNPTGGNRAVVTEIMFDPETPRSERPAEWFEIANVGDKPLDLAGWTVTAGNWKVHTIGSLVIAPAALAVLAASGDGGKNGGVTADYVFGMELPLYNRSGRIIIKDTDGAIVDRVEWKSSKGFPMPSGHSINLNSPSSDNALGPQFGVGDLGTPGSSNDCAPLPHANIVISEIHINPDAVSDTIGEWLELTNAGESPVDIEGWQLRDDDVDRHVIRTDGSWVIASGESVVLGPERSKSINGGAPVDYSYGTSFPLSNSGDEITLIDNGGVWVDRVEWASRRRLPASAGISASLRSIDLDNAQHSNWCASVTRFAGDDSDFGTPGDANVCEITSNTTTTVVTDTTTTAESETATTDAPTTTTTDAPTTTTTDAPATTTTVASTTTTTATTTATTATTTATTATTVAPATSTTVAPATTATAATVASAATPTHVRPFTAGFGVLATGPCDASITGSKITVGGGVRSNGDVSVQGNSHVINGPISYAGSAKVGKDVGSATVTQDSAAIDPDVPWTLESLQSMATEVHLGNWKVGKDPVARGIHFVLGDVQINGSSIDLTGLTIVSTGKIKVAANTTLSPANPSLPTLFSSEGSCTQSGIQLTGNSISWTGVIAAPSGIVKINGSKLSGGVVLGAAVQLSGSDIHIG